MRNQSIARSIPKTTNARVVRQCTKPFQAPPHRKCSTCADASFLKIDSARPFASRLIDGPARLHTWHLLHNQPPVSINATRASRFLCKRVPQAPSPVFNATQMCRNVSSYPVGAGDQRKAHCFCVCVPCHFAFQPLEPQAIV